MRRLEIEIERLDGTVVGAELAIGRVINLGYATRDPAFMEIHLAELRDQGIDAPRPAEPPLLIPLTPAVLSTSSAIEVQTPTTSGEVEFVLGRTTDGDLVLGVGSDHTDRDLERYNIGWSKQVTANVVSTRFWLLDELSPDLDEIMMKCWTSADGLTWVPYQSAPAREFLAPANMLDICARKAGTTREALLDDTVVFSGTPHSEHGLGYLPYWRVTLEDTVHGRSLTRDYRVVSVGEGIPDEWLERGTVTPVAP